MTEEAEPVMSFNPARTNAGPSLQEVMDNATPFAKLVIGLQEFQLAHGATEDDLLYRKGVDHPWRQLYRKMSDGWHAVAAGILILNSNALSDYIRMHLLARKDGKVDETGMRDYDLFDLNFQMRAEPGDTEVDIRLPGQDWTRVSVDSSVDVSESREQAIHGVIKVAPELSARFSEEVEAWARRMAAGATVMPIM